MEKEDVKTSSFSVATIKRCCRYGAGDLDRTDTLSPTSDFESDASALSRASNASERHGA